MEITAHSQASTRRNTSELFAAQIAHDLCSNFSSMHAKRCGVTAAPDLRLQGTWVSHATFEACVIWREPLKGVGHMLHPSILGCSAQPTSERHGPEPAPLQLLTRSCLHRFTFLLPPKKENRVTGNTAPALGREHFPTCARPVVTHAALSCTPQDGAHSAYVASICTLLKGPHATALRFLATELPKRHDQSGRVLLSHQHSFFWCSCWFRVAPVRAAAVLPVSASFVPCCDPPHAASLRFARKAPCL